MLNENAPAKGLKLSLAKLGFSVSRADTSGMNVLPSQYELLAKMLEVNSLRHHVISQNVANVNTPGVQRLRVEFEDALIRQLKQSSKVDVKQLQPRIVEDNTTPKRADGNNIDIDKEMARLEQNTLLSSTYLQIMTSKFNMLRRAISSG